MPVEIAVCIKQVPHPDYFSKLPFDPVRGAIDREKVPAVINPGDKNALEEALRIRERYSGRVTAVTMGPPPARKALEEALAIGADEAVHLCDLAFAGADTLATAWTLAYAVHKLGDVDLILCGNTTIDSGTGQVAVQLAELLDFPGITSVEELVFEDDRSILVRQKWERGHLKVRLQLPAVVAVTDRINQPRLPSIMGIMAATQKEIKHWKAEDIAVDVKKVGIYGSPTKVLEMSEFHARREGQILQGSPKEMVTLAVDRLVKLEML